MNSKEEIGELKRRVAKHYKVGVRKAREGKIQRAQYIRGRLSGVAIMLRNQESHLAHRIMHLENNLFYKIINNLEEEKKQ